MQISLKTALICLVWCLTLYGCICERGGAKINELKQISVSKPYTLTATVYSARKNQTKKYLKLASGILVRNDESLYYNRFIAVSQDLLKYVGYGDTLNVISSEPLLSGLWIVQDCMSEHKQNSVDFLISRDMLHYFANGRYSVQISEKLKNRATK